MYGFILPVAALAAAPAPQAERPQQAELQCHVGPVVKTFGGNSWLVYSCSDATSLVVVSDKGNPASPFYFIIFRKDGKYELYGEGNGSKEASSAAYEELKILTSDDIVALLAETKTR